MKTILSIGTAITVLGMVASTALGQTQTTSTSTTTTYIEASKLIGTKVKGSQGDQIGEIKDVVLDQNGCMAYTVLSTGGTGSRLTGSSKTVAVPWAVYSMTSDPKVVTVRVEKEKIYNAPVFDYARVREYSTGTYLNNVYSYYGVSSGVTVGVSTGVSNATTTTNTDNAAAATTTTTAASPAATPAITPVATPAPTAAATATASPMPSSTLNPAASASPEASAAASAAPSRHGKGKSDTTSASERRGNASANSEKGSESSRAKKSHEGSSADEETPSSSSHKHHRSSEGSKSESSATPGDEKE